MTSVLHEIRERCCEKGDETCGIWLNSKGDEVSKLSYEYVSLVKSFFIVLNFFLCKI